MDYLDPPNDEIPGAITGVWVITEHDDVAISVQYMLAHSTGLLITFGVRMPPGAPHIDSDIYTDWRRLLRGEMDGPATGILLGYRFASGQWRSTIRGEPADLPQDQASAPISVMSGRNRGREGTVTYWPWPLPEGDVTFFARWTSQGLPYGTVTVPAERITSARPDLTH